MDYKAAVFIGRFQPLHKPHLEIIRSGLEIAERVIIVVGSATGAPNIKNPFSFEMRSEMIRGSLTRSENERVEIEGVRDYYYSEQSWITDVQRRVGEYVASGDTVALLGNFKDSSSYYLRSFPQWEFVSIRTKNESIDATSIRQALWERNLESVKPSVPEHVFRFLSEQFCQSNSFLDRISENEFLTKYKESWKSAPFQPTFVTADSVVIQSGHILLIRRKINPGKGLLALPGGFLRGTERIEDAAVRELKEETSIKLDKATLRTCIKDSAVFDHPGRSLRGRTITHAYLFRLREGELPEVKGNDDASGAFWMPLMDLGANESKFFEDHFHIINFFLGRV